MNRSALGPQALYGREAELRFLATRFELASRGDFGFALVAGHAGSGKTSLVQHFVRSLNPATCLVVSGKHDQYRPDIPYQAIREILEGLVRHLLTMGSEELAPWVRNIDASLGPDAALIIDLAPELAELLGRNTALRPLAPLDAKARFRQTLFAFLRLFCRQGRPTVLFFDDLQWADEASLDFLKELVTVERPACMSVLGAYREEEIREGHLLAEFLDAVRQGGWAPPAARLAPLDRDLLKALLGDALVLPAEQLDGLVEMFSLRTQGNPLLVRQLLGMLNAGDGGKMLPSQGRDASALHGLPLTEAMAEILGQSMGLLAEECCHCLGNAACLEQPFDLRRLASILRQSQRSLRAMLQPAMALGLLRVERDPCEVPGRGLSEAYGFSHDLIRQEALKHIDTMRMQRTHVRAGTLLLTSAGQAGQAGQAPDIFALADHFNQGGPFSAQRLPRMELARLNLSAGQKAKTAMALGAAKAYLERALAWLPEDALRQDRGLAFTLHLEHASLCFLLDGPQAAEPLFERCLGMAPDLMAQVGLFTAKAHLHLAVLDTVGACAVSRQGLALLGVEFPEQDREAHIQALLEEIDGLLGERSPLSLADDPIIEDQRMDAIMNLMAVLSFAFWFDPPLHALCIMRSVALMLRNGQVALGLPAYVAFGTLIAFKLGRIDRGYAFGLAAMRLREGISDPIAIRHVQDIFGTYLSNFKNHPRVAYSVVLDVYERALKAGEIQYACLTACNLVTFPLAMGMPLELGMRQITSHIEHAKRVNLPRPLLTLSSFRNLIANLMGRTESADCFDAEGLSEQRIVDEFRQTSQLVPLSTFYILKMQSLYLHGRFDQAMAVSRLVEKLDQTVMSPGLLPTLEHLFLQALTLTALAQDGATPEPELLLRDMAELTRYAEHNPDTYGCRLALMQAEVARVRGEALAAMELYDQAIDQARAHGFLHIEAAALELAGRFWMGRQRTHIAQGYMARAYARYAQWGTARKLELLEREFPGLRALSLAEGREKEAASARELWAAVSAAQALSSEMRLDALLRSLARLLLETAGAERVCIIMREGEQLLLLVDQSASAPDRDLGAAASIEQSLVLPHGLVRYVARTGNRVRLDDVRESLEYGQDEYLRSGPARSLLCVPIVRNAVVMGVAYLEHRRFTAAFAQVPLPPLELICAQAAISIENARLYRELQAQMQQLREADASIRELSRELLRSQEGERRKIARDLHDDLAQRLTALKLRVEAGLRRPPQDGHAGTLQRISGELTECVGAVRELAHGLRPPDLEQFGLRQSVAQYCGEFSRRTGIPTEFNSIGLDALDMDAEIGTNLYRIVQEGLANVLKHARARRAVVRLSYAHPDVFLRIEDDGVGFDTEAAAAAGRMGLAGIRERARLMGGTMRIKSSPGHGAQLSVIIPLPEAWHEPTP